MKHTQLPHDEHHHKSWINHAFNVFATSISNFIGHAFTFILAVVFVGAWALLGKHYQYSENWQLVINTSTTIITFLIVFLLQHTQNRDTEIINLKLNELIKIHKRASNDVINLNELTDDALLKLEEEYKKLKDAESH